jgi:cyclophilin family peptidyl-prolyl cis-trans isomerase
LGKIAAVAIAAVIIVAIGWYAYGFYYSKPRVVYARIDTTFGAIEVELFPDSAPKTVTNFESLVNSSFYNNLVWHRIVNTTTPQPFAVIQTGDPQTRGGQGNHSKWGSGGSNNTVPLEIDPSLHNSAGTLGMARGQSTNSGSSQFYINVVNNTSLDGGYTVFGKVISGMKVVNAIDSVPTNSSQQPVNPVYVLDIVILKNP